MRFNKTVSSHIVGVGYQKGTLYIKYAREPYSGLPEYKDWETSYKFYKVSKEVYKDLLKAESKGKFMHKNIYGQYKYEKY